MEHPIPAELAEYAALGIRPNARCFELPYPPRPRFVIRRLPVGSTTWAGNLDRTPWKIKDRLRPGWMGRTRSLAKAIIVIDEILSHEQTPKGGGLPWDE